MARDGKYDEGDLLQWAFIATTSRKLSSHFRTGADWRAMYKYDYVIVDGMLQAAVQQWGRPYTSCILLIE
jgi:hypothetical protein